MDTTLSQKERSRAQTAIIELRQALGGWSQQELAVQMGKALVTVARWETSREPSIGALKELQVVAQNAGHADLAREFGEIASQRQFYKSAQGKLLAAADSVYVDALLNLLHNRHAPSVDLLCREIVDLLITGNANLPNEVIHLIGDFDAIQNTVDELRRLRLSWPAAAAPARSKKRPRRKGPK